MRPAVSMRTTSAPVLCACASASRQMAEASLPYPRSNRGTSRHLNNKKYTSSEGHKSNRPMWATAHVCQSPPKMHCDVVIHLEKHRPGMSPQLFDGASSESVTGGDEDFQTSFLQHPKNRLRERHKSSRCRQWLALTLIHRSETYDGH